jgi:lactoylglutathione lyase
MFEDRLIIKSDPSLTMSRTSAGMRLHQVLLQVKDMDRSKKFYTEILGLKLRYDFSPEYLAVLTSNKLQIGFHPYRRGSSATNNKDRPIGIEFQVDDVDFWYKRLRKLGVRFIEKPRSAWGEMEARFLDPDGYRLAISSKG